jgi:hypothetical protein
MQKRVEGGSALAIVAEIADALAPFGSIPCVPMIHEEDGLWTLTATFKPITIEDALRTLELATALRRVADLATIRGIAERYGIDAKLLDALVTPALADIVGDGSWPWCRACRSYHHPNNPTCRLRGWPAEET